MMRIALNVVAFQICWFTNVLAAADGMPWVGPVVMLAWLIAHLAWLPGERAAELRTLIAAALIGWLADSTLVLAGLIAFSEQALLGGPSPLWMVALWVGFAATLRHALRWLRGRWVLAAVFGAAGGPLAYLGGEALGAISLAGPAAVLAVAVQYAIATPVLLAVAFHSQRAPREAATDAARGASS